MGTIVATFRFSRYTKNKTGLIDDLLDWAMNYVPSEDNFRENSELRYSLNDMRNMCVDPWPQVLRHCIGTPDRFLDQVLVAITSVACILTEWAVTWF